MTSDCVRPKRFKSNPTKPHVWLGYAILYTVYWSIGYIVFETTLDDVRVYGSTFEIDFTDSYVVSTQEFERIFTKLRRAVIGWFFRKVAGTEVPNAEPIVCPSRLPGCRMNRTVCQASSKQEKNNEKE